MTYSATMTEQKFRYTEKEMKIALKQSLNLCIRGLIAVWQYCPRYNPEYTPERMAKLRGFKTPGFSESQERFMLELVNQLIGNRSLNPPQEKALLKRMPRYARWLARIGNLNPEHRLDKIDLPSSIESAEIAGKLVWFYIREPVFDRRKTSFKTRIVDGPENCEGTVFDAEIYGLPALSYPAKTVKYLQMNVSYNSPMGETVLPVHVIGVPEWLSSKMKLPAEYRETDEIEKMIRDYNSKS